MSISEGPERKTVVNKFTKENPPASAAKYFKQLGFDPIYYRFGPDRGQFRKTIKQVYGFCQRFISSLSKDTLYNFRHPGRQARPDNSVVDRELVYFLRLRGEKLFGGTSYNKQSNSQLITYCDTYTDKKLIDEFKALREILQHLAFILNQRDHRGQTGHQQSDTENSEDEEMDMSAIEDAHTLETETLENGTLETGTLETEIADMQDASDVAKNADKDIENESDDAASSEDVGDDDYEQQSDDNSEHDPDDDTQDAEAAGNRTTTLKMSPRFLRKISREDALARQDSVAEMVMPLKAKPRGSNTWNRERNMSIRNVDWYDEHFPDGREPPNWAVADLVDGLGLDRETFDGIAAFTRTHIVGHDYLLNAALNGGAAQERITVIIAAIENKYGPQAVEKQPNCTRRFRERSWREFIKKECGKLRKEQNIGTGRAPRKDKRSFGNAQKSGQDKTSIGGMKKESPKSSPDLQDEASPDFISPDRDQAGKASPDEMNGSAAPQRSPIRYPSEKYYPPDVRNNSPISGKSLQQAKKQGSEIGHIPSWKTVNGGNRKHGRDDVPQASGPSSPDAQIPSKRLKSTPSEGNPILNDIAAKVSASPTTQLEPSPTDTTVLPTRPQFVTPARNVTLSNSVDSPSATRNTPSSGFSIQKRGTWPIRYGCYNADGVFHPVHEGNIGPSAITMIYETIGKEVGADFDFIEATVDERCPIFHSIGRQKFIIPRIKPYTELHAFLHQQAIEKRQGPIDVLLQPVSNAMTDGEDLL